MLYELDAYIQLVLMVLPWPFSYICKYVLSLNLEFMELSLNILILYPSKSPTFLFNNRFTILGSIKAHIAWYLMHNNWTTSVFLPTLCYSFTCASNLKYLPIPDINTKYWCQDNKQLSMILTFLITWASAIYVWTPEMCKGREETTSNLSPLFSPSLPDD